MASRSFIANFLSAVQAFSSLGDMKSMKCFALCLCFAISLVPLCAEDAVPAKTPPQILTNQGLVALAEAGYDEGFLLDLIQSRQTRFDTSADGLRYLAEHGLCEHVVRAMLARANSHDQHAVAAMPVEPAALQPGVRMVPLAGTAWLHGSGFPMPNTAPLAPCRMVRKRSGLLHHRWYVVEADGSMKPAEKSRSCAPAW